MEEEDTAAGDPAGSLTPNGSDSCAARRKKRTDRASGRPSRRTAPNPSLSAFPTKAARRGSHRTTAQYSHTDERMTRMGSPAYPGTIGKRPCLKSSVWSGRRDSNPRQPAWKAGTLPD